MICPKCGARLAQGSTICPICGTKIRPSKVKVQDNYEEQPDQGYDSDSDDDYEENLNERTLVSSLKKLIADRNELKANCRKKQLHRANPIIVKYLSVFAKKDDRG